METYENVPEETWQEDVESMEICQEGEPTTAEPIEINIDIIKTIFMNFLSLYGTIMMKNCHSCDIIRSEEFVRVHNNFVDIDGLLKVFDLSFDKTLLENFVKKGPSVCLNSSSKNNKEKLSFNCLIPACTKQYSSFESVQVHFLKSHCCPIQCFEQNEDFSQENGKLNFAEIPKDSDGSYICKFDEYCHYTSKDRSNFRVHYDRHRMAKRFHCFVCNKYFAAKEPLIIHFIRVHFTNVPWNLASTNIRSLRKSIRKMTTPGMNDLDIDQIPDIEEDLTGPETLQNLEISAYISQAINHGTVTRGDNCTTIESSELIDEENNDELPVADLPEEHIVIEIINPKTDEQAIKHDDDGDEEVDTEETPIKKLKARKKNFHCTHDYCSQNFYAKKGLLIHLKSNHDPENQFECDHDGCFSRFKTPTLLAQHKRRHNCQLQCEHCDYRTHLNAQMEKHVRLHTGQEMPYVCPECCQRFPFLGQMSNHRKKEHKVIESLACDSQDCGKIFKTIVGLHKHKREFHMKSTRQIPK